MKAKVLVTVGMTIEVDGNWDNQCKLDQINGDAIRVARKVLVDITQNYDVKFGVNQLQVESVILKV